LFSFLLGQSVQFVLCFGLSIDCEYEVLTEKIINREGTDICPMEKTVFGCDNAEEAYGLLKNKLKELKK
jgi:hypothetical protein